MGVNNSHPGALKYIDNFRFLNHYAALQYGLDKVTPEQWEHPLKIFVGAHVYVAQDGAWIRKSNRPSRGRDVSYSESAALSWGFWLVGSEFATRLCNIIYWNQALQDDKWEMQLHVIGFTTIVFYQRKYYSCMEGPRKFLVFLRKVLTFLSLHFHAIFQHKKLWSPPLTAPEHAKLTMSSHYIKTPSAGPCYIKDLSWQVGPSV